MIKRRKTSLNKASAVVKVYGCRRCRRVVSSEKFKTTYGSVAEWYGFCSFICLIRGMGVSEAFRLHERHVRFVGYEEL